MSEIVISAEEARHERTLRQGLQFPFSDPRAVFSRVVAIQSQYGSACPVALSARCSFDDLEAWVENELDKGTLIKSWNLRATLHTSLLNDENLVMSAVGPKRMERYISGIRRGFWISESELVNTEKQVLKALSRGPLTRTELHRQVPILATHPWAGWGGDVIGLAYQGKLALLGGKGSTRFCARKPPKRQLPEKAAVELLRRYLAGYGPATLADFVAWSAIPSADAAAALRRSRGIERVKISGIKGDFLRLSDIDLSSSGETISLLAKFDTLVMGYRDRTLFLPDDLRSRVVRPAGQIESAILVRSEIQGTWRAVRKGRLITITCYPFRKFSPREKKAVASKAEYAAQALGGVLSETLWED